MLVYKRVALLITLTMLLIHDFNINCRVLTIKNMLKRYFCIFKFYNDVNFLRKVRKILEVS